MRVGYIAVRAQPFDGWGRYTVGLVRAAQAQGIEPVLVTAEADVDPALDGIERHPLLPRLFRGPLAGPRTLSARFVLRRVLATCDVVHGIVEPYGPLIAASVPGTTPYVQTAHGTWAVEPLRSRLRRWFYSGALRRADLILFQSAYTRDQLARFVPLPRHLVLPGGVDPADLAPKSAVELPPWSRQGPLVLSVGSIRERKGHHIGVEAVARASDDFPSLQHVIIGGADSPRYGDALREQAARLGLAGRLHLLGRVSPEELAAWYARADVFMLLPVNRGGTFEGLGLAYLEAGACRTACIATRDCGAAEAVIDGETGLTVPQDDPVAAAEALRRLLAEPDLRRRLGDGGRRHAVRLSWTHLAEKLGGLYLDLVAARRLAGAR